MTSQRTTKHTLRRPSQGRGRGWKGVPVPLFPWKKKIDIFPCSPKSKSWFSLFPVPPNCFCSPIPFSFRLLFPCSHEINGLIPLFLQTPGRASLRRAISELRSDCASAQTGQSLRWSHVPSAASKLSENLCHTGLIVCFVMRWLYSSPWADFF